VYVVAIAELEGSIDGALKELAADLATTPYELRLIVNGGLPAIVLATIDAAAARAARGAIERYGHVATLLDRRGIVPSGNMTELVRFAFRPSSLIADDRASDELPYADIGALVRAMHRGTTTTTEQVKERKLRPVMAIATGGMVMSKKTTREVTRHEEHREQVLYLFRRSGEPPFILRERGAIYSGLGAETAPTAFENFQTTIRRLRERAPGAAYDERLMTARTVRGIADGSDAADLLAYLIAAHAMGGI
jgi:hypothetical protein